MHINNLFCKLTQYVTLSYTLYLSRYATIAQTLTLKIAKPRGRQISVTKEHSHEFVYGNLLSCIPQTFSATSYQWNRGPCAPFALADKQRHDFSANKISERAFNALADREHLAINIKAAIYGGSLVAGSDTCRQSSRRRASVAKCIWTIAKFKNKSKFEGIARS